MKNLTVEYLVIVETKDSILSNKKALSNFLESCSDISIKTKKLIYKGEIYEFEVITDELTANDRYFQLKISCSEFERLEEFERLLSILKDLLSRISKEDIITIWDDISFHYANLAYPLIYQVENLMRKLITLFMYVNVGSGWVERFIPNQVKQATRHASAELSGDYLYQTDFIQLAHFLFKEYQSKDINSLFRTIDKTKTKEDIDLSILKEFVPKSNWDRYFAEHVEASKSHLDKKWKRLYKLRCQIAHNNSLSKRDYQEVNGLVRDLVDIFKRAIEKLEIVQLSKDAKDEIIEQIHTVEVFSSYFGTRITARFDPEKNIIHYDGHELSPSKAATQAKLDNGSTSEISTNGWKFWKYIDESDNSEQFISNLRQ